MEFKEVLYKFLTDKDNVSYEELEFLFVELKKIIYFAIKDFLKDDTTNYKYKLLTTEYVCEDTYSDKIISCVEEIFPLLVAKIYKEKEKILNVIQNRNQSYIKSYLKTIVKNNFILDPLKKYKSEFAFEKISLNEPEHRESTDKTREESLESPVNLENEILLFDEANHLIDLLQKNLTEKEKKVLCFDEYNIEDCIKDSSKDATYKGRERYRKKLKDIMLKHKYPYEIYEYAVEKGILMSEICKKICL